MFLVIEYKRDIEIAKKVLSGMTLHTWTAKSKAVMGMLRQGYKGYDKVDTETGFKVYQEGTVKQCKDRIDKLLKNLVEKDLKHQILSQKVQARIFKVFRKRAAKVADRMDGTSALSMLNQAGILVTWKTVNKKSKPF